MRVLQIIQAQQYRGAEIFCCQLSSHLLDKGHEVIVVSIYGGSAILPFKKPVVSLNRPKRNRYFDFKGWKDLANIISDFQPDVIQANAADTLKYAIFSKFVFRWKVPVIYRNASASSFYIQSKLSKAFNAVLLKYVDLIISVSESSKKDLNLLFPFTASKTDVIPVGIEKKERINSLNHSYDENQFNIVHAGSFTREKNHHELLDIFKLLLMVKPNSSLHLIGEGDLKKEIENRIKKENLNRNIYIYGGVKNPLSYIQAADALVLPSLIEGLPGVLLEAMKCKTPVVAYNVGGVGEIVLPGTGILIEKGDKNSFANSLRQISENSSVNRIENAFQMVMENYINADLADEFLVKYRRIVQSRARKNGNAMEI